MKIKSKQDIYNFLSKDLLIGNIQNFTIKEIVSNFKKRYSEEVLDYPDLNSKKIYDFTVQRLEDVFKMLSLNDRDELSFELVKLLKNKYCLKKPNKTRQYFLAAVIHICFEYVKESASCFSKIFSTFERANGEAETFCRLILVAKIENYCIFRYQGCRDWYIDVIQHNGEVVENTNLEYKQLVNTLWKEWCPKGNNNEGLRTCYNFLNKCEITKSIYWPIRLKKQLI